MDAEGETRLRELRADFEEVTGKAFSCFHCPILFRDENVELCKAHIVNQAFSSIGRQWTVQRADVDRFFGRCFESDFVDIQFQGQITASKAIVDRELAKAFRPQLRIHGQRVSYYYANDETPSPADHARVQFEGEHGTAGVRQLSPKALEATEAADFEIRIERDLRLPALVSLIKVAHLTLFRMLGYRYALSDGGHFMGWSILGDFYLENHLFIKRLSLKMRGPTSGDSAIWCVRSSRTIPILKELRPIPPLCLPDGHECSLGVHGLRQNYERGPCHSRTHS